VVQRRFQAAAKRAGGVYLVCRDPDAVVEAVSDAPGLSAHDRLEIARLRIVG
jgi:hypothetical protein